MFEFPRNPSRQDLRLFGSLLGLFIPLVGWLVCRRFALEPPWVALGTLSTLSFAAAAVLPSSLKGVHWLWHAATFPIGWLVSRILLAIVYWGVLTPIAWSLRLRGRDTLGRRFDPEATSYWMRREPIADIERYFRPF